ncbi:MAG: regulatory iron-sulfur-containing complex subunit RicT [Dehalococcoidia bacterium]
MDDPIVGVRFADSGPISYCKPGALRLGVGDYVVVTDDRGERLGWVVLSADQVVASEHPGPLRVVDRLALEADVDAWRAQKARAQEDLLRAQATATRSDPRIRVASLEYNLAGTRGELGFTAPERVEHEWLRRQVGELLGADVRVQQVGDRDRAKAAGGLGVCGLALCCSTWMTEFPAISIKMAKDQDLAPNPTKISGVCGRLLCCLAFEVEEYRELRGGLPKVGKNVTTPAGRARVLSINLLRGVARLRMENTGEVIELGTDELRNQFGTAVRPAELEEVVESPIRQRQARLDRDLVAVLRPVAERPLRIVEDEAGLALAADSDDETSEGGTEGGEEGARRRRRRGRRGGRRRRGEPNAEGAVDGAASAEEGTPALGVLDD